MKAMSRREDKARTLLRKVNANQGI